MNEEEEDDSAMGAVRYPCMPSLVSLQHMKNRLHLAYLGRKLMKWTALATGRELRRVALAIDLAYKSFADDIRHAFILLARGRYFCPIMNRMVLENVADCASVTVGTHTKALTGVKVIQYKIIESGVEPYEHLGIENGGQPIHEAKIAWLELLKRLVLMLELRVSFLMVDAAHKSATKRLNVINKIVIPRTNLTIAYILIEMQEAAREELFRIKIIKKNKLKSKKKVCSVCKKDISSVKKNEIEVEPKSMNEELCKTHSSDKTLVKVFVHTPEQFELKESVHQMANLLSEKEAENCRLKHLKKLLTVIIATGKDVVQLGLNKIDIDQFLNGCEEAKTKIDSFFQTDDDLDNAEVNSNLRDRLDYLKKHIHEVMELAREFTKTVPLVSSVCNSVDNFVDTCGSRVASAGYKLGVTTNPAHGRTWSDESKYRLERLERRIKEAMEITKHYNNERGYTLSIENIVKACESVQKKIESYIKTPKVQFDESKLDMLKSEVGYLEKNSSEVRRAGMYTKSLEKLAACCKNHKDNLDTSKTNKLQPTDNIQSNIHNRECPISKNINDFIECCENIKKLFEYKDKKEVNLQDYSEVNTNINNALVLLKDLKAEGLLSDSLDEVLKHYEIEQSKDKYALKGASSLAKLPCQGFCSCGNKASSKHVCEMEPPLLSPPCQSCSSQYSEQQSPVESCITCSQPGSGERVLQHNDSLGLFEKRIKKIVKVTRTLNKDGTIREETETTIIKRSRHDPTTTSLADEDDDDIASDSFENIPDEDEDCTVMRFDVDERLFSFPRKVKSEKILQFIPLAEPHLKHCISIDMKWLTNDSMLGLDLNSNSMILSQSQHSIKMKSSSMEFTK